MLEPEFNQNNERVISSREKQRFYPVFAPSAPRAPRSAAHSRSAAGVQPRRGPLVINPRAQRGSGEPERFGVRDQAVDELGGAARAARELVS
jgi:hypothetical protein